MDESKQRILKILHVNYINTHENHEMRRLGYLKNKQKHTILKLVI